MRVTSHKHLAIATIILAFAFTCYGASVSEPNAAEANLTAAKEVAAERDTATQIKKTDEFSDSTRAQIERLAKEYYKDTADRQGRALYTVIAIVAGFVIYVVFKDRGEYNKAVAEAREASKEARNASDKARGWEEKAREKLASIDEKVADKLKEIEAKGKTSVTDLTQEGKKQRKISELFTKGINAHQSKDFVLAADYFEQIIKIDPTNAPALSNWAATLIDLAKTKKGDEAPNLFGQACEKCEKAIQIKPDDHVAYNNWGTALSDLAKGKEGDEADKLLAQACEKYEKAIQIKPDKHGAYNNWGTALSRWAKIKEGDEADKLFGQAKEKCLKAESIKTGSGAYNLACAYALLGEEKDCQSWLKTAEQARTLPTRQDAMADLDLKGVRNKAWFKQIRWKGE